MKKVTALTALDIFVGVQFEELNRLWGINLNEDYSADEPEEEEEATPDMDVTLADLESDDSDYIHESADRVMTAYKYAQDIAGADVISSSYDTACQSVGCGGTDFEDLTPYEHCELSRFHCMARDLNPDKSSQKALVDSVLYRLHNMAEHALTSMAYSRFYRAQDEARAQKAAESPVPSPSGATGPGNPTAPGQYQGEETPKNPINEHTPGIRRALRALGRTRTENKERIKQGKSPIIGGEPVSAKKFKKVTGKSTSDIKKEEGLAKSSLQLIEDLFGGGNRK